MNNFKEIREYFSNDVFATKQTKIIIDELSEGYAKCHFEIAKEHLNANNFVMGGATYTLADYAFSLAANTLAPNTVTISSSINYIGVAKGKMLIATAKTIKSGRNISVYDINVTDDLDTPVAHATFSGFRK